MPIEETNGMALLVDTIAKRNVNQSLQSFYISLIERSSVASQSPPYSDF